MNGNTKNVVKSVNEDIKPQYGLMFQTTLQINLYAPYRNAPYRWTIWCIQLICFYDADFEVIR